MPLNVSLEEVPVTHKIYTLHEAQVDSIGSLRLYFNLVLIGVGIAWGALITLWQGSNIPNGFLILSINAGFFTVCALLLLWEFHRNMKRIKSPPKRPRGRPRKSG